MMSPPGGAAHQGRMWNKDELNLEYWRVKIRNLFPVMQWSNEISANECSSPISCPTEILNSCQAGKNASVCSGSVLSSNYT
jgi:hypothetical protein